MRIRPLLPSATEIVASLGLVESLVAVSEAARLAARGAGAAGRDRLPRRHGTAVQFRDRPVRARKALGDGRPLYAIDRELLEALEPDLILTQNLCSVCAVSSDTIDELCATDVEVVTLDAHTLAEIEERILSLADLLGVPARGHTVVTRWRRRSRP